MVGFTKIAVLVGFTLTFCGCGYQPTVSPLVRQSIGRIECRTSVHEGPVKLQTPWAKSDAFNRAFGQSFSSCLSGMGGSGGYGPGAGVAGLLIIIVGATAGSISGANAEKHAKLDAVVASQGLAIRSHVAALQLWQALQGKTLASISQLQPRTHPKRGPPDSVQDCRLELVVEEVGLRGFEGADPDMRLFVRVSANLICTSTGKQLCHLNLQTESRLAQRYDAWSLASSTTLQQQVDEMFERIALRVAEELLAYEPI